MQFILIVSNYVFASHFSLRISIIIMVSTCSRITTPVPTKKHKVDETELPFDTDCHYFDFPLLICCENCKSKKEQEMKLTKKSVVKKHIL